MYIADCMISIANCRGEKETYKLNAYDAYLKAWEAVREFKEEDDEGKY